MVMLVEVRGTDFVKESFPSTFKSKWWAWTEETMQAYGAVAAVPVAAMPIILHPLIFFAKLSNMSNAWLLGSILVGRIDRQVLHHGPDGLSGALGAQVFRRLSGPETIGKVQKAE
ncbi:unnamed protein product [Prorocentrum cordatum]|uniref:Solute carrier family 40 protein n=1 Tax=Prorocentrum cordatum TaxID=2364126 RepID=A0ABN9W9S9_9DINO|nr:unnamed protein product [Polarella glacialis]